METSNGGGGGEEQLTRLAELSKNLKEGERILAPTRRPDGTLRKPIRIRAGYVPQEEVAIYQSKGTLLKKEMAAQVGPPGYDPELDAKPKTKAGKRNERKKEKRLQAALEKDKNLDVTGETEKEEAPTVADLGNGVESVEQLTSQMNELGVSLNDTVITPSSESMEGSNSGNPVQEIDKRIRALKKKIRLLEAQQLKTTQDMKPEQLDKLSKLEGWRMELQQLEDQRAEMAGS